MKLLLSKKEKARYYRRLRIKIYLCFATLALAGVGAAHAVLNLGWLNIGQNPVEPENVKTEQFAIWCAKDRCAWIDRQGITGAPAPLTEGSSIPIIKTEGGVPAGGAPAIQARFIKPIIAIIEGVANLPIRVNEYLFNARLQELTAVGINSDKFIFSVRFEPTEKLFASLAEVISRNNLKNFEYIDLTVENRIYLKQR